MGESMQRINKKIEAFPHAALLSNYKVQAFIAEYAFQHRKGADDTKPDEYDAMPVSGNTVMKWWMDKTYHDKYRTYVDDTPEATVDPHSENDLQGIMQKILTHVPGTSEQTIH